LKIGNIKSGLLLATVLIISSCTTPQTVPSDSSNEITKKTVIENYSNIVLASYQDSLDSAKNLQASIKSFISNPTKEGFENAKEAWIKSRLPYGQTEAYRFYQGAIDMENGPEVKINSWPLDEVFIDYVEGNNTAGIINNLKDYPEINADILKELNQKGGDKNISTGFHAIEFLLWGQDLSEGPGAGLREYTDYVTDGNGTNQNQERRAKYLMTVTDLLVSDLEGLVNEWSLNKSDNYRAKFLSLSEDEALTKILKGAGTLSASELSNQRMATPLEVGEKEEEHSCFSDTTGTDIIQNTKSIENVLMGTYTKTDGTVIKGANLYDLIKKTDSNLAEKLKSQLETSSKLVSEIKSPFDQEIKPGNTEGNERVKNAIKALETQGLTIVELGSELGLSVNTEL
jgi:putative iron-regulated protein